MVKAKAKGKQRTQDKWYILAKEQGYRSRASFKLTQLDDRHDFLRSSRAILDLCAAPGGWLQVAVHRAPVGAFVLGVDLAPIRPIHGALAIVEDITTAKCRAAVRRLMDERGVSALDLVLHDGSPNVGGAWAQEATSQSTLVLDAARLATLFLARNGTFVTKVFRSQDYNAILYCLKQFFERVDATKPPASRSTSAEIYVVCKKYKAPAKIDPRLLDPKHLFQGALERPKVVDVLRGTKKKRNREGYEEGNNTLWKLGKASEFIWSEAPLEFLGSVNAISFDDDMSLAIKNHEFTTDEVKSMCEDLYVLDRNSFKHLLKWRLRMRKALASSSDVAAESGKILVEPKPDSKDAAADGDENLLKEMEELSNILDRKKRREKKRLAKRRAKDKERSARKLIDATIDDYNDHDLFSLNSIKGNKALKAVEESNELNEDDGNAEDSETEVASAGDEPDEMDSDEEQKRYDEQVEEIMDELYDRYLARRGGKKQEHKRAKRVDPDADADLLEGSEDDADAGAQMDCDFNEGAVQEAEEVNPLLLPLARPKPTREQLMEQWFSQDVFAEAGHDAAEQSDSDMDKEPAFKKLKERKLKAESDIEIVPEVPVKTAGDSSSSSDSDESDEDQDVDTKAEILAYAKKMLRKKQREQILDDAYNRYTFDDDNLPKWFLEEERKHRQLMKPVTKEEVLAMRAQFKEIDARPAKKVAEAKARKKRVVMKKMEKARKKADVIADQNDISERSKQKMIDKLYRKAAPQKPKKEYVVAKKGVRVKAGKGKVLVDRRMKKDKRARGSGKAVKGVRKKGGKGGKGVQGKGKGGGRGKPAKAAPGRKGRKADA